MERSQDRMSTPRRWAVFVVAVFLAVAVSSGFDEWWRGRGLAAGALVQVVVHIAFGFVDAWSRDGGSGEVAR